MVEEAPALWRTEQGSFGWWGVIPMCVANSSGMDWRLLEYIGPIGSVLDVFEAWF